MNEKNEVKQLIMEYIDEEECIRIKKTNLYNCETCKYIEECFEKVKIEIKKSKQLKAECNDNDYDDNDILAELINYGGYETKEDFWNELLE